MINDSIITRKKNSCIALTNISWKIGYDKVNGLI
jgi:hypothetical protein